jgi:hypothetical protein
MHAHPPSTTTLRGRSRTASKIVRVVASASNPSMEPNPMTMGGSSSTNRAEIHAQMGVRFQLRRNCPIRREP